MSADNGYVLRKNSQGKCVLQMYFASADAYPPIDAPNAQVFDTSDEALEAYAKMLARGEIVEYGLTLDDSYYIQAGQGQSKAV